MKDEQTALIAVLEKIDPRRMPYITEERQDGTAKPWTYHPVRRHLILRTGSTIETARALGCVLLAKDAYLGPHSVSKVPRHLVKRHGLMCQLIKEQAWGSTQ